MVTMAACRTRLGMSSSSSSGEGGDVVARGQDAHHAPHGGMERFRFRTVGHDAGGAAGGGRRGDHPRTRPLQGAHHDGVLDPSLLPQIAIPVAFVVIDMHSTMRMRAWMGGQVGVYCCVQRTVSITDWNWNRLTV